MATLSLQDWQIISEASYLLMYLERRESIVDAILALVTAISRSTD